MVKTLIESELKNTIILGASNTGNGLVNGVSAPIYTTSQVWTLTCTKATTDSGTFSVVGSVSGAKTDLTVGTAYDNGLLAVLVADGSTDWAVGDTVTIDISRINHAKEYALVNSVDGLNRYKTIVVEVIGDATNIIVTLEGTNTHTTGVKYLDLALTTTDIAKGGNAFIDNHSVLSKTAVLSSVVFTNYVKIIVSTM